MSRTRELAGFTLIELMVVVALLAVFAAVALPSFTSTMHKNRVEAASNELLSLFQYARSEAVTRSDSVTVALTDGTWSQGVVSVTTSGGTVLRSYDANGFNLPNVTATSAASTLTFRASGALSAAAISVKLCYSGDSATAGKQVNVAASGQISVISNVGC